MLFSKIADNSDYFRWHKRRFEISADWLEQYVPKGSKIADIGSHRLYFDALLVDRGYSVVGFDAPEVVRHEVTQRNAQTCGIPLVELADFTRPEELPIYENAFDCLILFETIEHIAFNPLTLWNWMIDLVKPGGLIVITTPNSMRLHKRIDDLKRILKGKGRGILLDEIFDTITRGHHWKEFSAPEMVSYFGRLGIPSENVIVKYGEYGKHGSKRALLNKLFPSLRDELFVVVKIGNPKAKIEREPSYSDFQKPKAP